MADTKISALADLGAAPASGDLFVVVDVSDTSMGAGGTTKKVAASYVGGGVPVLANYISGTSKLWMPVGGTWLGHFTGSLSGQNTVSSLGFIPASRTVSELAVEVTTAATAGEVVRLGIYSLAAGSLTMTLVADCGTVAVDSTGVKAISGLSVSLSAGDYAFVVQAPAAASVGLRGYTTLGLSTGSLTTLNGGEGLDVYNSTGALASSVSFTVTNNGGGRTGYMFVRWA